MEEEAGTEISRLTCERKDGKGLHEIVAYLSARCPTSANLEPQEHAEGLRGIASDQHRCVRCERTYSNPCA